MLISPQRFSRMSYARHPHHGFSLIELLVVIAIIVTLATMAGPAFNAIMSARTTAQAGYDILGTLELARTEAITRRTYIWVGFQNSAYGEEPEIRVGTVYSKDGTNDTSAGNLAPLTRILHAKNVAMVKWDALRPATRNLLPNAAPESVFSNEAGVSFSVGTVRFEKNSVTFTPQGQALLKGTPTSDDGYIPLIDASVRQTRGGTPQPNADDITVVVNGATGTSKLIRQQ